MDALHKIEAGNIPSGVGLPVLNDVFKKKKSLAQSPSRVHYTQFAGPGRTPQGQAVSDRRAPPLDII